MAAFARLRHCGPYCQALVAPRSDLCPSACDQFASACFSTTGPASDQLDAVWGGLIGKMLPFDVIVRFLGLYQSDLERFR